MDLHVRFRLTLNHLQRYLAEIGILSFPLKIERTLFPLADAMIRSDEGRADVAYQQAGRAILWESESVGFLDLQGSAWLDLQLSMQRHAEFPIICSCEPPWMVSLRGMTQEP